MAAKGQRAADKVTWAVELLIEYEPELLSSSRQLERDESGSTTKGNS